MTWTTHKDAKWGYTQSEGRCFQGTFVVFCNEETRVGSGASLIQNRCLYRVSILIHLTVLAIQCISEKRAAEGQQQPRHRQGGPVYTAVTCTVHTSTTITQTTNMIQAMKLQHAYLGNTPTTKQTRVSWKFVMSVIVSRGNFWCLSINGAFPIGWLMINWKYKKLINSVLHFQWVINFRDYLVKGD